MTRRRPVPKSKQIRTISVGSLGESSCSENTEVENDNLTHRALRTISINQSQFRTPEKDSNITDYGLEFGTTCTSRQCSILEPLGHCDKNSNIPHNAVSETQKSVTATKLTKKVGRAQTSNENTNSSAKEHRRKEPVQVVKHRRKRRNPLQLQKRFWKEVQALQNRTDNLIPMLPFSRVVREIMQSCTTEVTQITRTALEGLQLSSELFITQVLQDAYVLTLHRGRLTLDVQDIELLKHLKLNFM